MLTLDLVQFLRRLIGFCTSENPHSPAIFFPSLKRAVVQARSEWILSGEVTFCKAPKPQASCQNSTVCSCSCSLDTELEAKTVRDFDERRPNYYVRLGCLSARLRTRAYNKAVAKIQEAKLRSKEFICELNSTVDLVGLRFIDTNTGHGYRPTLRMSVSLD